MSEQRAGRSCCSWQVLGLQFQSPWLGALLGPHWTSSPLKGPGPPLDRISILECTWGSAAGTEPATAEDELEKRKSVKPVEPFSDVPTWNRGHWLFAADSLGGAVGAGSARPENREDDGDEKGLWPWAAPLTLERLCDKRVTGGEQGIFPGSIQRGTDPLQSFHSLRGPPGKRGQSQTLSPCPLRSLCPHCPGGLRALNRTLPTPEAPSPPLLSTWGIPGPSSQFHRPFCSDGPTRRSPLELPSRTHPSRAAPRPVGRGHCLRCWVLG